MVEDLIQITPNGVGVMNTAFIERFLAMMKTLRVSAPRGV
jgi:hypothetical protein